MSLWASGTAKGDGAEPKGFDLERGLVATFAVDHKGIQLDEEAPGPVNRAATPVVDRWGWPESAFAFDGKRSDLSLDPRSVPESDGYTLAAWIRVTVDEWAHVIHICRREPSLELAVSVLGDRRVAVSDGKKKRHFSRARLHAGRWQHVAVTVAAGKRNEARYAVYIDGVLDHSAVAPYRPNARGDVCNVGSFFASKRFFKGGIDDIYIYRRPLGAGEILQLAWPPQAVLPGIGMPPEEPLDPDLVRAWENLAMDDARTARMAAFAFLADDRAATAFLRTQLFGSRSEADQLRLRQLVASLASEDYPVREAATRQLSALDPKLVSELKVFLKEAEDPETRLRLRRAISEIGDGNGWPAVASERRRMRTIYVLEEMASPDARELVRLIRRAALKDSRPALAACAEAALARLDMEAD